MPEILLDIRNNELFVGLCPEIFRFWYELCEISSARSLLSHQLELLESGDDIAFLDIRSRIDVW